MSSVFVIFVGRRTRRAVVYSWRSSVALIISLILVYALLVIIEMIMPTTFGAPTTFV